MLFISIAGLIIAFAFFGNLFSLTPLSFEGILVLAIMAAATILIFNILYNISSKLIEKDKNKIR